VVAAIEAQLQRFTHTCWQVVPYEGYVALAEKLNALTPGTHAKKTALFSTGAEAVENAVKIARAHTGRSGVIAFGGAFHGRSLFAVALTGKVQPYKAGFGPFPPEIYHAPFPRRGHRTWPRCSAPCSTCSRPTSTRPAWPPSCSSRCRAKAASTSSAPRRWTWLRELCDAHGIVLIADEVQTGFGRTGRLFAMQHHEERSGVVADLLVSAKSLAAGVPLSAVTGRAEIMDAPAPAAWAARMPATRSPWRRRTP
jgi:4-aminobutyrate aminotransferase